MIDSAGTSGFFSAHRGLWTDRTDALARLTNMDGQMAAADMEHLRQFITDGFTIIPGAVSDEDITALVRSVDEVLSGHPQRMMTYWDREGQHRNGVASREHMMETEAKLLDIHAISSPAQEVIFAPTVNQFLQRVFQDPALAFQCLYFERGSEQRIHQDTAFVPVADAPLDFVASWIALEDVEPGTGELLYVPGSHRLPDLTFENGKRCTPDDPHIYHYDQLVEASYRQAGLEPVRFLPKKGDALFWAADLCHGGSPIEQAGATRRSIITHYCPLGRRPLYATQGSFEVSYCLSGGYIISQT